jgi:hypothetical protein
MRPVAGPPTGQQPPVYDEKTTPMATPIGPTFRTPANQPPPLPPVGPRGGGSGSGGPRGNKRLLIIAGAAVAVVAVLAVVLVVTLTGGSSQTIGSNPSGSPIGSAPAEAHGRRPITEVLPSSGKTLKVAQDGSGQFTSIAQAAQQAGPGDTVLISAGTYNEPLDVPRDGTQGNYITFSAAPGADVKISGEADKDGLVYLKDRQWIRIVGITVADSSQHGIYSVNSSHILVQDSGIAKSHDGGMVFIGGSDIQLLHNDIRGTNDIGTDAKNEAVSLSGINGFDVGFNIVAGNGEEGIDAKYDSTNGKIHDNTSDQNRGPNVYVDGASNIDIYDNTITGATGDGKAGLSLGIEDASQDRKTAGIRIYNNVISGNSGGGISFYVESDGTFSDIQIINNTVVNNPGGDGINPKKYDFAGTNVLRNNIFTGNKRDIAGQNQPFAADHNLFGTGGPGTDNVTGAVEFVDPSGGDLRLKPDSPGANVGNPDGAPTTDINGTPRPSGQVDLGAFEDTGKAPVK